MEDPAVVGKFATFSVHIYIFFLKDMYVFVLPFRSCRVLSLPHVEEKFTCDQLTNEYVQVCVCPLVDAED